MSSFCSSKSSQSLSQRVFVLSQKLNYHNAPNKPSENLNRYKQLEGLCGQLQDQLQEYKKCMNQQMFDVNNLLSKIERETQYNYEEIDEKIRYKISITSKKVTGMIEEQDQKRKINDSKIMKYIDQQAVELRNMIDIQSKEREQESQQISQALQTDFGQIKQRFQEVTAYHNTFSSNFNTLVYRKCEQLKQRLINANNKYADDEAELYKAMRDIFKKVKQELEEHQTKRQQAQSQILQLIDNLCDKAIAKENTD